MSGFVAGHELAASELKTAEILWKARELVREYLTAGEQTMRAERLAQLDELDWAAVGASTDMVRRLEVVTRIIQLMPPPFADDDTGVEKTKLHRVPEQENDAPTEYAVRLPPEYHPLRNYPAIVVLHSGDGPNKALDQWEAEATRRGYILIAPEYAEPGKPVDYRYTTSEHAAVELALRDARKRYAIDSDRIFAAGPSSSAPSTSAMETMPLAHPDEFAGVVVISGLPARYVPRYLPHHDRLPLFYVVGEYVPAVTPLIYEKYVKPLILKTYDITYVEYYRRGLEELPEQIVPAYDWMDRHRREPYPKSFKAYTARTSDARFNGIVVRDFSPGRTTAAGSRRCAGAKPQSRLHRNEIERPLQPDPARGERDQEPRRLAQPEAHRLQALRMEACTYPRAAPTTKARSNFNATPAGGSPRARDPAATLAGIEFRRGSGQFQTRCNSTHTSAFRVTMQTTGGRGRQGNEHGSAREADHLGATLVQRRGKTTVATTSQIREAIGARPFHPFLVRLADGRRYEVDHPEFAMLGRDGMDRLFIADDQGIHHIYVPLIVEIETPSAHPAPPGPGGNGP